MKKKETGIRWWWLILLGIATLIILIGTGCSDFLSDKSAGVESNRIIKAVRNRNLAKEEPNVFFPQFLKEPPKIIEQTVGGKKEFKLFYFCQHHISDEMKKIVHDQFASTLFDAKGKSNRVADYTVSSNPATNQLIVRCPDMNDAKAVFDFIKEVDVPPIQVKVNCIISEVYADKTIDWETTILIEELFGEGVWAGPTSQPYGTAVMDLVQEASIIPSFPGASMRELARSKMGLKLGYVNKEFLALVDLLESQGYLKILMNPTLEIINGKTAEISSTQKVPIQQTYLRNTQSDWIETKVEFEDVIDSLKITPHVFADGYIGLETAIVLGSKLTPEGVKQLPIVTRKEIQNEENRIRPGKSLIIGGIRKIEKRDVIRGVPFLKDIPLIGMLFSGRDFEERAVETIFILTPTISDGGIPNKDMIEEIKIKHNLSDSK